MWTDEKIERMKELWAARKTLTEIAAELELSRGAISGKLNRLGLMQKQFIQKRKNGPGLRESQQEVFSAEPCTLMELTEIRCPWPLWGNAQMSGLYCGCTKMSGKNYCRNHEILSMARGEEGLIGRRKTAVALPKMGRLGNY